jgi:hypothetical protein
MTQELTKEVAKGLMEIKGEVRGVVLKTDADYVLKEKGKEGLKKVEEEFKKLDYPIKYKEIKTMAFYPVGLRALSLLAIKKVFNFDEEKIREIGLFATKVSLIVKLFIRSFLSVERVFFKEAPRLWKKHWTAGELDPIVLDEEKKYGILRLKDFSLHPIFCCFLEGYFAGVAQMVIKSLQITCQETKCTFRGDEHHEYLIKWE